MKDLGMFFMVTGGLGVLLSSAMSLFCIEERKDGKFANSLYRWIFITSVIIAIVGGLVYLLP